MAGTRPLDPGVAWACFMTNLLVLPGLGSIMARRRAGYPQMGLSIAGCALTTLWLISWFASWQRSGELPVDMGPYVMHAIFGIVLFGVSWTWGLATGLAIVRDAREKS